MVKIRPRKACSFPNLRSFGWVSHDKVGVVYSGISRNRSEARASDLRSYPALWWNRLLLRLYEGNEGECFPRTCLIGKPAAGTLCLHPITFQINDVVGSTCLMIGLPWRLSCSPRHTGGMRQVLEPFLPPPLPHRRHAELFSWVTFALL